jgi:predicted aspartyl protease
MLRLGRTVAAVLAIGVLGSAFGGAAQADCRIKMLGEFPLEPTRGSPWMKATVNGVQADLLADTGSVLTIINSSDAVRVNAVASAYPGLQSYGVGGQVATKVSTLDFSIGKTRLKEAVIVLDGAATKGDPMVLLGRDLLMQHDLELDLANHALRILQPEGCQPAQMIYWNKPYSQAKLQSDGTDRSAVLVDVVLNGHIIPAMIDSGANVSVVTPEAATLAGVRLDQIATHGEAHGLGPNAIGVRQAEFASFTIGDETIQNVQIQVADLWKYNKISQTGTRLGTNDTMMAPKMLLGADFLHAHRVIIAHSQGLLLFSYVGGPVFDVSRPPPASGQTAPADGRSQAGAVSR